MIRLDINVVRLVEIDGSDADNADLMATMRHFIDVEHFRLSVYPFLSLIKLTTAGV